MGSTELVQKHETARENGERNPEVEIGNDRAKNLLGSRLGWG